MSDTVIKVENLSKSYTISHQSGERYTALRDVLANGVRSVAGSMWRGARGEGRVAGSRHATRHSPPTTEEFWALNDVSFEIKQGERVGIIGRNGAGKSTLLKILSRITEPTKGRIHIKGRVASLLEVGTGFHPELTGRENIYLNGAILGMSREEIRRKFDEIVAFAEVEKFLDTPVKRYSSGMYVRLAFAVAAHLEPEILIVDEVLAVGDTAFQKKCLGKMEDVTQNGRVIVFVSHNMVAIERLCPRSILLSKGHLLLDAASHKCTSLYIRSGNTYSENGLAYRVAQDLLDKDAAGIQIVDVALLSLEGEPLKLIQTGDSITLRINYKTDGRKYTDPAAVVTLHNDSHQEIFVVSTTPISGYPLKHLEPRGYIELRIEALPFTAGRYYVTIEFARPRIESFIKLEEVIIFDITAKDVYGSGFVADHAVGIAVLPHKWSHECIL